jgi:hypothetical protein
MANFWILWEICVVRLRIPNFCKNSIGLQASQNRSFSRGPSGKTDPARLSGHMSSNCSFAQWAYKLHEIEANHLAYAHDGNLAAASEVEKLQKVALQRRQNPRPLDMAPRSNNTTERACHVKFNNDKSTLLVIDMPPKVLELISSHVETVKSLGCPATSSYAVLVSPKFSNSFIISRILNF